MSGARLPSLRRRGLGAGLFDDFSVCLHLSDSRAPQITARRPRPPPTRCHPPPVIARRSHRRLRPHGTASTVAHDGPPHRQSVGDQPHRPRCIRGKYRRVLPLPLSGQAGHRRLPSRPLTNTASLPMINTADPPATPPIPPRPAGGLELGRLTASWLAGAGERRTTCGAQRSSRAECPAHPDYFHSGY